RILIMDDKNMENNYNETETTDNHIVEKNITNKDLTRAYTRWAMAHETMRTFERGIGPAYFYGMYPILKKIYGDNKDQLVEAVRRSLNFFNGQFSWIGNVIGIATSLEEELKHDLDTGEETMLSGEVIENTKVALFGPMAGIGDSITNGTIHYIIIALFLPLV